LGFSIGFRRVAYRRKYPTVPEYAGDHTRP
jgi:hypothetical protein